MTKLDKKGRVVPRVSFGNRQQMWDRLHEYEEIGSPWDIKDKLDRLLEYQLRLGGEALLCAETPEEAAETIKEYWRHHDEFVEMMGGK